MRENKFDQEDQNASADAERIHACPKGKADSGEVTVFNSLSFERESLIELPKAFANGAHLATGEALAVEEKDGKVYAIVKLPALGAVTIVPGAQGKALVNKAVARKDGENIIVCLTHIGN